MQRTIFTINLKSLGEINKRWEFFRIFAVDKKTRELKMMTKRIVAVLFGIVSASCMYAESALPLIHNVMAYESSVSASMRRNPTAADVPTAPRMPIHCCRGPRSWVATSSVWLTTRTTRIWTYCER